MRDDDPELQKMYYRNHVVARSTLDAVAHDCPGQLRAEELGGTLLARDSWYDADGTLHVRDPNTRKTKVWCTCGRIFLVNQTGDEVHDAKMIRDKVL